MSKLEALPEGPAEFPGLNRQEIAQRAYQLWEERGRPHGSPDEDWHRAERELRLSSNARNDAPAGPKETSE